MSYWPRWAANSLHRGIFDAKDASFLSALEHQSQTTTALSHGVSKLWDVDVIGFRLVDHGPRSAPQVLPVATATLHQLRHGCCSAKQPASWEAGDSQRRSYRK